MKRMVLATCVVAMLVCLVTAGFKLRKAHAQAERSGKVQAASPDLQRLHRLTMEVLAAGKQMQAAQSAVERQSLRIQLQTTAAARKDLLTELMTDNPGLLLQVALPSHITNTLGAELQSYFEQEVDLEGELEVMYEENEVESRLLHFLKVGDTRLTLHFVGDPPRNLLTGTRAHVRGVRVGDEIALTVMDDGGATSTTTSSSGMQIMQSGPSIQPNTFGEQKVLVLLVNFQDNSTQPWTIDQVRNTVFTSVNNYYLEGSFQQTWLTGDVFGWYTLPITATCTESTIGTYAKQAATAAGINLSAYNRLVYAYPTVGCGWTGSSNLGGNPSQAWINGSMSLRTVAHELGHGFGLYHSSAWDCGSEVVGATCSSIEYGDVEDIMGQPGVTGHFNSYQKERLGWLGYGSSPPITTVQSSGTYAIDPYESAGSNSKALKILKSTDPTTGKNTWYYVEFRRPVGFDSFISGNSNLMNGVMIHMGADSAGYNYLLDLTPGTSSWSDAALDVGRSYNDPTSNVTITPASVSNTGAMVNITFGPQPCVHVNPSLTLSPAASQWVSAGSTVNYQLSLTNNDSGCSTSSFNVQASIPVGWSAALDCPVVNLDPGATALVNLSVVSPSSAPDGFYNIGVAAVSSAGGYSASGSVTCSIMSGLALSVTSDQASYTRSQTATVTAMVSAGGSPVSGASVSFTMTKSNGTKVTATATSDAKGAAVFKYRFNKQKDPVGIYEVASGANLNGVVGSGAVSFSVK